MPHGKLLVNTDDWSAGNFTDRDGRVYRVEGQCEQSRCNAVCCRVANWRGQVGKGPCTHLTEQNLCGFHAEGGPACKPIACFYWPLRQNDVDETNRLAEKLGLAGRCHLKVIEVKD